MGDKRLLFQLQSKHHIIRIKGFCNKKTLSFAYVAGQRNISCFIFQLKVAYLAAKPEPTVSALLLPMLSDFQSAEGTADFGGAVLHLAFLELRAP